MPTRTIYLFDDLGNKVAVGTYEPAPVSLTVGGSWTNIQYTGSAPDTTGLTFTCTFSDGTSSSVVPTSVSPSTWSSTAGTQTATFSYTAGGVTVSTMKTATVVAPVRYPISGADAHNTMASPGYFTVTYSDSSTETYHINSIPSGATLTVVTGEPVPPGYTEYTYTENGYTTPKFAVLTSYTGPTHD